MTQGIETAIGGEARGRARPAEEMLADARAVVEPVHRAAVDRLPGAMRRVAGYHAGWWDVSERPVGGGGKAMRPALVLGCARAAGGDDPAAVPAAVAVELVHDFSLLHDDVMDRDLLRRHRPAAWSVFGSGRAILAGDMLLVLALELLPGEAARRALAEAVLGLCAGQSDDLEFEERTDVTLHECFRMAERKTGALLACACRLGAMAAGADPARADLFQAFGRHLGLAFQIVDDLLGIWGDPAVTGKPVHSDLASRKKTLPVVAGLTSRTLAGAHLAALYDRELADEERDLPRIAALVEASGARAWAREEAARQVRTALAHLEEADPDPDAAHDLRTLTFLITRRDH